VLFSAHRGSGALLLVAVAVLALPACSKSKKPAAAKTSAAPKPTPTPSPTKPAEVHADFHAAGVAAVDAQNRASSNDVANAAAKKVIDLVNSYYDIAFLTPSRWGGGTHPDLGGLFGGEVAGTLGPDLPALALGSVAPQLSEVQPNVETATTIKVLIEPNQLASFAVVNTHFEGTGKPATAAGQNVHIVHDFQFMMDVGGGRIVAYDAATAEDGVTKSASYFPPDSQALAALGSS